MEHLIEVHNLFHGIRWHGLLSIPKSGIGDEDFFRRINEDKFIIKFHPANLIIGENTAVEVRFLNIQERKLLDDRLAMKGLLLSVNGHSFRFLLSLSVSCPFIK
jgi:hypothetical protein